MTAQNIPQLALPVISPLAISSFKSNLSYIGAAGFEPRTLSFLDEGVKANLKLHRSIGIKYEPIAEGNIEQKFYEKIRLLGSIHTWQVFNRFNPQTFSKSIFQPLETLGDSHILVDISAMSKFLIMILLNCLRFNPNPLTVIYSEADIYYPTRKEFEQETQPLNVIPDFLTNDVYSVTKVSSLSSVAMQGHPILLIFFPTFNHYEFAALYNEYSPKYTCLLEGDPHEKEDKWRLDAIKDVNRSITSNLDFSQYKYMRLSTFSYEQTVHALENIYRTYSYTHKILLAPTGSKLQTLACFIFRQMHPDVQVVYPTTRSYSEDKYTNGCRAIWSVHFNNFADFIGRLESYRRQV